MTYHTIDEAGKILGDTTAPWMNRRDAADDLCRLARQAITTLHSYENDKDADVRLAVTKALKTLASPKPIEEEPVTLDSIVRARAKPGEREITKDGDGYRVTVNLKQGRRQIVYVDPYVRSDDVKLVRVYTLCGPPKDENLAWALKANAKLVQSAVALIERDGQEQLALVQTYLDGNITKTEMHASVKEISFYGDWIEGKMTSLDEL